MPTPPATSTLTKLELDKRVLDAAARYLEVPPDFAFTDSTTMGLGLVYGGIRIKGRPVATEHDFYSTHESLRLRFKDFEQIRLYDDPAQATRSGMVEAARTARGAGVLALTWVHSGTGVKIPAQEIAEAVRPTLVVLDGVHGLAVDDLPIDSVDVLVAGTHKWLGGPRGTGLVWSRVLGPPAAVHPDLPPRTLRPRTGTRVATTRSSTAGRSPRRSTSTTGSAARR